MVSQVAHKPALFPRLQEGGIHHVLQLQSRSSCRKRIVVMKTKSKRLCLQEPGPVSPACSQAHCHGEQGNPGAPCVKQQKLDPHHPSSAPRPLPSCAVRFQLNKPISQISNQVHPRNDPLHRNAQSVQTSLITINNSRWRRSFIN